MPRPWHKSPLFYLGLFGLAFIVWAWVESNFHRSDWSYDRGNSSYTLSNVRGAIQLEQRALDSPHPGGSGVRFRRSPHPDSKLWFPAPRQSHHQGIVDFTPGQLPVTLRISSRVIPHWLLILTYLALWSLLLFWRSRRIKRLSRLKLVLSHS